MDKFGVKSSTFEAFKVNKLLTANQTVLSAVPRPEV